MAIPFSSASLRISKRRCGPGSAVLDEAYGLADAALAKRRVLRLGAALDHTHPGAAASLREGLNETLSLQRLGITGALYRTLRGTNALANLNLLGHFVRNRRR